MQLKHSEAEFIEAPELQRGRAPYFRRGFELADAPTRAVLRITALGVFEPWLNGVRVGDEILAPGWTSYRHRLLVSTFDVTTSVHAGENVVGAILGNGWACGRLGWDGLSAVYRDAPALYLTLDLEFADGRRESIVSGPDFRVATGAILADDLYDGEDYDARLEPVGWSAPGFDASAWSPAVVTEWPKASLVDRVAEPVRETQTVAPVTISTAPSGATIVDFGQNLAGWIRIRVTGSSGTRITLRHGELLTPDGELETANLRTAKATDRYTLAGDTVEHWQPRFTFHGFRYAEVSGWPGELGPDDLEAVVIHTDMRRTGWFETSDPLLNRLHENAVWGMRGNFIGLPTDCPQRDERLGWTGDINAFGPTAAFLYDVRGILGSWLADVAAEHADRGYVPWYVPAITAKRQAPTALWGDVVISLPWALYREYGDVDILSALYPTMVGFLEQVLENVDADGIWSRGFQFGDWLDPDAPEGRSDLAKANPALVATAYLYRTTNELARIAELLGHDEDAARFQRLHENTGAAFRREFVTPSGRVVDEAPTSYALAIVFGLLDEPQAVRAGDRLVTRVADAGFTISTGFAGTPHILDALVQTGHADVAYRLLLQQRSPSFFYPVTSGATTIWERWDAVRADGTLHPSSMTSLNHYAFGSVADWMHRTIGGLSALAPGYSRVRIAPQLTEAITSASVRHDTARGLVEVSWTRDASLFDLEVTLPDGVTALVTLPDHPESSELEIGSGTHLWSYELPHEEPRSFGLDSTTGDVGRSAERWAALFGVLKQHFPMLPDELAIPPLITAPQAQSTVADMLEHIPWTTPEAVADVERVLQSMS